MNEQMAPLTEADLARADAALADFFRSDLPSSWPAAPQVELAATRLPRRTRASHWALAASVALWAMGLGLFAALAVRDEAKPLPDDAGPPTAHRPIGSQRPGPSSKPLRRPLPPG